MFLVNIEELRKNLCNREEGWCDSIDVDLLKFKFIKN